MSVKELHQVMERRESLLREHPEWKHGDGTQVDAQSLSDYADARAEITTEETRSHLDKLMNQLPSGTSREEVWQSMRDRLPAGMWIEGFLIGYLYHEMFGNPVEVVSVLDGQHRTSPPPEKRK